MKAFGASKEADLVWESDDDEHTEPVERDLSLEDKEVCEAFSFLRKEFHSKFTKMWA
jgi:hypothetical protein